MKVEFSPADIGILLHYHSCATDFILNGEVPDLSRFVQRDLLGENEWPLAALLIEAVDLDDESKKKLLKKYGALDRKYFPTQRLHAYVRFLCATPIPGKVFIRADSLDRLIRLKTTEITDAEILDSDFERIAER